MTGEITVEATGETVGEAKWSAVRELQRRVPGLDREAIRFQVVTEGERGLLGVGYTPGDRDRERRRPRFHAAEPRFRRRTTRRRQASSASCSSARSLRAVCRRRCRSTRSGEELVATLVGPDLGVLIGRHGQTIDALQYLANAIGHRTQGDDRARVVVDAAGYRARRAATLETSARRAAEQAVATGRRVELEPMTAVERRIVHELLKDDPEVGHGE